MSPAAVRLSVIVPVYGSERSLPELVERLDAVLPTVATWYEIVLVNDASPDGAWAVVERLAAERESVLGINLLRNYGQHNALLAGIRVAAGDIVVTMDDDLQHRPEELPRLLEALTDDIDLVYGYADEEEHGLWRNLSSRLTKLALASALGFETARKASAFRAFRATLRNAFADNRDSAVALDVLLSWGTTRVRAVPVHMEDRRYGRSGYTFGKLVSHALNLMTGYSTAPLRAVTYLGLTMAVFGVAILAVVIGRYIVDGRAQPGFAFIASTISIFSGAQLAALGILGEYLGRVHFRSMGRPTYAVRETTHGRSAATAHPLGTAAPETSAR